MKCPNCQNWVNVRVIDSRPNESLDKRNRRYECPDCEERFSTVEIYKKDYDVLLKEDFHLLEDVRELKVVLDFLLRSIFSVAPTLDARVIREKVSFCSKEMQTRISKYTKFHLRKD